MCLEQEYGVKLFGGVTDISALGGGITVGHPIQPMQTHDVVDAQQTSLPQMMPNNLDKVVVLALAKFVRMQRRKTPTLAFGKKRIGWSAARGAHRKRIAIAP